MCSKNNRLVAVSMRVDNVESYSEERDAISRDWISFFNKFNVQPLLIPNGMNNIEGFLNKMQPCGLLLTGGNSLGALAGERDLVLADSSEIRDQTEKVLLDFFVERTLPILGICRGMQKMNLYFGGGLNRSLSRNEHVAIEHELTFISKKLRRWCDESPLVVNSFHENGVLRKMLASGMVEMSAAGDVVEALWMPQHKAFGMQWHPERSGKSVALDERIFESFLNEYGELL